MELEINHCFNDIHKARKEEIKKRFRSIVFPEDSEYLSLYKYLKDIPEKFYCEKSYSFFIEFLNNSLKSNKNELIRLLKDNTFQLDVAIRNLANINITEKSDEPLPTNDLTKLTLIDSDIHYKYIRLLESPFFFFLLLPASLSRLNRNKSTDGLDLYNVIEELKNGVFSYVNDSYCSTIRNGIAHGKVSYTDKEIIYEDKKGNKVQIPIREIVKRFDTLLYIVNGFCLALSVFYFTEYKFINKHVKKIPTSLLISELQDKVNCPGWEILTCLDSITIKNQEQIIVYVKNYNWDYKKVLFFTFQTAYWVERLTKSYDRVFFHIDSKNSLLGWAGFDAKELRRLRKKKTNKIEDYKNVLENNLVFFNPKLKFPKFIYKLGTLRAIFKVIMPFHIQEAISKIKPTRFSIRDTQIHSQSSYLVIDDPCVVINIGFVDNAIDIIRTDYREIIRKVIKYSRKRFQSIKRHQKVKFIRICIFDKDERVRNLRKSGLHENLIATIGYNQSPIIKTTDIIGGIVEQHDKYRIVWNKNWRNLSQITSENQ